MLLQAIDNGYTHNNIANDLSGSNAARKLIIIAREIGLDLSVQDVDCESLLPKVPQPPCLSGLNLLVYQALRY